MADIDPKRESLIGAVVIKVEDDIYVFEKQIVLSDHRNKAGIDIIACHFKRNKESAIFLETELIEKYRESQISRVITAIKNVV